jgi:hypothetical protein
MKQLHCTLNTKPQDGINMYGCVRNFSHIGNGGYCAQQITKLYNMGMQGCDAFHIAAVGSSLE